MTDKAIQSSRQGSIDFASFDAEAYLTRRLGEHGAKVFEGDVTREQRIERFRDVILTAGLDCTIIGKHQGKCETYADYFERIFHDRLTPKVKGKR